MARCGSAEQFMAIYNPGLQSRYCRDLRRVHTGFAPPLSLVSSTYGKKDTEIWIEIQLQDLAEFSGCREKLNIRQLTDTAALILETYGNLKVTELMLFFHKFKRGEYGKFYGSVDPITIMSGLREFTAERNRIIQHYANEEHRRQNSALIDSAAALRAYKAANGLRPQDSVIALRNHPRPEQK